MSTDQILGREQIRSLLTEVGAILHERRIEATVYVLGGAAMALEFDSRRITEMGVWGGKPPALAVGRQSPRSAL